MKGADALTKKLTHELNAQRLNRFGAPTEKLLGAGLWISGQFGLAPEPGCLAVDNAARCPPRSLLPTDPQPSTTNFRNFQNSPYGRSIGRYKASPRARLPVAWLFLVGANCVHDNLDALSPKHDRKREPGDAEPTATLFIRFACLGVLLDLFKDRINLVNKLPAVPGRAR